MNSKIKELQGQIERGKQERNLFERKVHDQVHSYNILENQITQLQGEIENWKKQLAQEKHKVKVHASAIRRMEAEYHNVSVDSMHERISTLESKLEMARIRTSRLEEEN